VGHVAKCTQQHHVLSQKAASSPAGEVRMAAAFSTIPNFDFIAFVYARIHSHTFDLSSGFTKGGFLIKEDMANFSSM
jgi:hypothetical protein